MSQMGLSWGAAPKIEAAETPGPLTLRALVDAHYDLVWRSLRRLGVREAEIDDGVQKVFLVADRKLGTIRPGSERSFLYQTALRVAADARRSVRRRREVFPGEEPDGIDPTPGADELVDMRRARSRLEHILDAMPLDLRAVFTLFELDRLTQTEIAGLLSLPRGTVASKLQRARAIFEAELRGQRPPPGDEP